ncbi:pectate lyase [Pseudomonas fluorescens]|uniref:pectate lyase n=2 Tax=Pseudomonas fluorescens TaxID=294 RepID=A0A944HFV0_PSEFL|nr:pectate lyase [Pseudomonas fluorescens]MBT2298548.1 pectate lyase [Pseudomonas fluorescens]MBT2310073.1 pectate lyase [Pseudomonas fluorescens]MBT2311097.1 pectate lyase [Pseudomonas fluorescens]MBT2319968.1 pectate lyase [Pseudomonas fluorescens]MBT2329004.1 pectate lyase [Pseudomonas fluorescens]
MAEFGNLSGLSQSGFSGLGLSQETGLGQTAQTGQAGLQELAGMLAEMLLGGSQANPTGAGKGTGDALLQALQGNGKGTGTDEKGTGSGLDADSSKELLTQILMALFEKILGAEGGKGGEGGQAAAGAGGGGGGGVNGLSGAKNLGGAEGTADSGSVEDLVNTLMKSLGEGSLNNTLSPTANGGAQVSQDDKLKELLEMIGQFMDSHPETFGTPDSSRGTAPTGTSPGSTAEGVPTAPGGGSPANSSAISGTTVPSSPGAPAPTSSGPTPTLDNSGAAPVSFPTASNSPTVVNETIKVGPGEVFDGQGKTFTAGSALGDGGQGESQKPIFELAEGATLKNVILGDNGADGVHVKAGTDAAVNVDNVHWTNVGEDALTVKPGGASVTNLNITNSSAQGANDKIFQLNADANVNVDNFKAKDFGTFMRTNGGQQGDWNLNLSNISAENGKYAFVNSDAEGVNLSTKNIDLNNVENAYSKLPQSTNIKEA